MEDNIRNIISEYFKDLVFYEDGHKYFYDGRRIEKSVSDMIKKYYLPFNRDLIAGRVALARGLKKEDLIKEWDKKSKDSCTQGHKAHHFGERFAYDKNIKPTNGFEEAVKLFFKELPSSVVVIGTETKMIHKDYLFCGTDDLLLYNKDNNNIIVVDFKTNEDLFKNYKGQKLLHDFNHLLDNPFNKYQIQLSYYQILLEQIKEIKVNKRKIVWLKNSGQYFLYDTEDYTNILKKDLEDDYRRINSKSSISLL